MREPDFIAALRTLPLHPGARDLRDDVAVVEFGSETLILTHDMIAEGVHYRRGTDASDVAWKLVAVNLSDLAAKGAEPVGVLIGASLGTDSARFVEGLRAVLDKYGVPLLGGDTIAVAKGADRTFGCTAIGRATCSPIPSRAGAKPGDALWVTGTIGAALAGFEGLTDSARYLRPTPRLAEGRALAPHVHAMCDISDGLLLDARRVAEASGCSVDILSSDIPVPPSLAAEPLRAASWGDDYELLFALPAGAMPPVAATRVGTFAPAAADSLLIDGHTPVTPLGYEHR